LGKSGTEPDSAAPDEASEFCATSNLTKSPEVTGMCRAVRFFCCSDEKCCDHRNNNPPRARDAMALPLNPDSKWQEHTQGLTLYDRERELRPLKKGETIRVALKDMNEEVSCPVCLGTRAPSARCLLLVACGCLLPARLQPPRLQAASRPNTAPGRHFAHDGHGGGMHTPLLQELH
jgi:hypothetical protein